VKVEICSKIYFEMYGDVAFFNNVMCGLQHYTPKLLEAYVIKINDVVYTDSSDIAFITEWEKALMWEILNGKV